MLPMLSPETQRHLTREFRSKRDIEIELENDEERTMIARRSMRDDQRVLGAPDGYHPDPLGAAVSTSLARLEHAVTDRLEALKLTISRLTGHMRSEGPAASCARDLFGSPIRTQNVLRGDGC